MEISLDKQADAIYIRFSNEKFGRNKVVDDDIIIDYDVHDNPIGIEMLNVSKRLLIKDASSLKVKLKVLKANPAIGKLMVKAARLRVHKTKV